MTEMKYLTLAVCAFGALLVYGCRTAVPRELPERLRTSYGPLNDRLSTIVTPDSSAISATEASAIAGAVFLDAREPGEYLVSHLPGAIFLGFKNPDYQTVAGLDRTTPLVVYCTVGYRSERVAEKLRDRGFARVYNLYGSLYAWKLAGLPLVDAAGPTDRLHTYNKKWGRFIPDTLGTKIH